MIISSAEFIKGAVGGEGIPHDALPHIAFIGRSNVGKSSLINSLTGRKGLAVSSSTPGRTLQLNFFLINNNTYFVDLPGYGYSKISLKHAEKMRKMIMWYFEYSEIRPKHVLLVIDAKVGPTKHDIEMMELLQEQQHPVIVVANKADKLTQSEMSAQQKKLVEVFSETPVVFHSAKTGKGKDELLNALLG